MSVNITIQEGGVAQNLNGAEEIATNKVGSSTESWVPEEDVQLEPLSIVHNGTYTPGSGVYGFSDVTVNVQIVTGTIDGVTYEVTVDDNGYLVYTEVEA